MGGIVAAVLSIVTQAAPYIEQAIALGHDVAPFVTALRNSLTEIGSPDVVDTAEFKAAQDAIKPFEDHIQAAAAAAALEPEA